MGEGKERGKGQRGETYELNGGMETEEDGQRGGIGGK